MHGSQPKYTIPEAIADMKLSVRYIRAHAADFKIDPNRSGVSGGSAGGHLSLMLGTAGDLGDPAAKDALVSAEGFARMYPRLSEFRRVLEAVDPASRFSSDMARRLLLKPPHAQQIDHAA